MKKAIHLLVPAVLTALLVHGTAYAGTQASSAFDHLYEADGGSGTIFEITPGGVKTPFASGLAGPTGLAFDSSGNLFEADQFSNTIFKFTPAGTRTVFASGLNHPTGLAFDASGNLFAADNGSGMIFKFTPGGTKTTFASGLSGPGGLVFDLSGNLYEADFQSDTIFKFTPGGTKSTFASGLNKPTGLTFTNAGTTLFEADQGSNSIFEFDLNGNKSGPFAMGLNKPKGLVFDAIGGLLEADSGTGTIFSFGFNGTLVSGLNAPEGIAFGPPPGQLLNISTRLGVLTGDKVLIAGFIVGTGSSKQVVLRALGPTLSQFGVTGVLADPTIELHDGSGTLLASNDNWKDTQQAAIAATGLAPPNNLEPAILSTLTSGNYTAIVSGKNNTTGVALAEVYDVNKNTDTAITNISTRGFVNTDSAVMIGGFISGNGRVTVIVRALGPTLQNFGVTNFLADPTLELHDANGVLLASNDNWQDTQAAEILASGFNPPFAVESAIVINRPATNTTAIVRGKNNTTGNALVEVYIVP